MNDHIFKEGYLEKKSLYLGVKRLRWMVIKGRFLYSYKEKQRYQDPTEEIDLLFFNRLKLSRSHKTHIKLYSGTESRILIAPTIDIANDWIDALATAMNAAVNNLPHNEDEKYDEYSQTADTVNDSVQDWYPHKRFTQETTFKIGDKVKHYDIDSEQWKYGNVDQILGDEYKINFGNSWMWIPVDKLRLNIDTNKRHSISVNGNNDNETFSNTMSCGLICKSVEKCASLRRLINVLTIHKKGIDMHNNELISFIHENKHEMLNDYHHILMEHLNEDKLSTNECNNQWRLIYQCITDKKHDLDCDISNCGVYLRNNREREKTLVEYETNLAVYMDILDSIHCYFIHSVDIGYRIMHTFNNENDNKNDIEENICYDEQLSQIKTHLQSTRKHVIDARGSQRLDKNKFMTHIDDYDIDKKQKKFVVIKKMQSEFSEFNNDEKTPKMQKRFPYEETDKDKSEIFGSSHDYWSTEYRSKRKYRSLQQELLSNKIYPIDKTVWNSVYKKSEILMSSCCIKAIRSSIDLLNEKYKIDDGQLLSIGNVIAVVLYTDYDTLSSHFSCTFRKQKISDNYNDIRLRNVEFDIWSQLLTETVNAYGITMEHSQINSFFHGVSLYYFSSFIDMFYCPTSTTTKLQIATIFAKEDGLILELSRYYNLRSKYLRYFNCSLFSCNANEDERLFLQPPVKYCYLSFRSILNIETNENYKDYIEAVGVFEAIIDETKHSMPKLSTKCANIIQKLLHVSATKSNIVYPKYVIKSFKKWAYDKTVISMNLKILQKLNLIHNDIENLVKLDKINKTFKNARAINCYGIGTISTDYMSLLVTVLGSINKVKHTKLHNIYLHGITNIASISTPLQYPKIRWVIHKSAYDDQPGEYLNITIDHRRQTR